MLLVPLVARLAWALGIPFVNLANLGQVFAVVGAALLLVAITERVTRPHRGWFFLIAGGVAVGSVVLGLVTFLDGDAPIMFELPLLGLATAAALFIAGARNHVSRRKRAYLVLILGAVIIVLIPLPLIILASVTSGEAAAIPGWALFAITPFLFTLVPLFILTCAAGLVWARLERRAADELVESPAEAS